MKAGIITIVDYRNFGNRLQNYAVYKILKDKYNCDTDTFIINNNKRFSPKNIGSWGKEQLIKCIAAAPKSITGGVGARASRLANFWRWSKLIPSRKIYTKTSIPESYNNLYDFFVTGSDQVWNYHFPKARLADHLLRFAEPSKKNSISASFGVDSIPSKYDDVFRKGLTSFNRISVREEVGCSLVKQFTDRDCECLVDPVMILSQNDWEKVSSKPDVDCTPKYILKCFLGDNEQSLAIDRWAKEHGFLVYELLNNAYPNLFSAGPGEYLYLVQHADLVCTDSFHCLAFSIIFRRPFIAFRRSGSGTSMLSRLETLLGKFNFSDRWFDTLKEEEYLSCDFSETSHILEKEQAKFEHFVQELISDYSD